MSTKGTRWLSTAQLYGIGAVSLVLVVELAWFTFVGSDNFLEQTTQVDLGKTEALSIRDIGSEQDFEEILERPLFIWNRKPIPVDASAAQAVSSGDIESRWELSGIIADGAAYYAYFSPIGGGQPTRLEQGMYFEKWKVKVIEPEQVVLISGENGSDESGAEQKVLRMKETIKPVKSKRAQSILAKRKALEQREGQSTRLEAGKTLKDTTEAKKLILPKQ